MWRYMDGTGRGAPVQDRGRRRGPHLVVVEIADDDPDERRGNRPAGKDWPPSDGEGAATATARAQGDRGGPDPRRLPLAQAGGQGPGTAEVECPGPGAELREARDATAPGRTGKGLREAPGALGLAGNCQQLVKLNEKDKEDLRKEKDKDDEAARCRWHERAGPIAQAIALNFEYKEALNAMAAATNTLLENDECLQLCTSLAKCAASWKTGAAELGKGFLPEDMTVVATSQLDASATAYDSTNTYLIKFFNDSIQESIAQALEDEQVFSNGVPLPASILDKVTEISEEVRKEAVQATQSKPMKNMFKRCMRWGKVDAGVKHITKHLPEFTQQAALSAMSQETLKQMKVVMAVNTAVQALFAASGDGAKNAVQAEKEIAKMSVDTSCLPKKLGLLLHAARDGH